VIVSNVRVMLSPVGFSAPTQRISFDQPERRRSKESDVDLFREQRLRQVRMLDPERTSASRCRAAR
jgi:hypothetical protein